MKVVLTASALVVFAALSAAGCGGGGSKASDLENTPWQLVSGKGITLAEGVVPSAAFSEGTVFGSGGCNQYRAPYTLDGDSLKIGDLAGTQMACPPPADTIEKAYVAALAGRGELGNRR